ncbi:MAG: right-handed parallel beta-helix repeat-containing protein [Flavobacteriales bacterium]|nr:right-handed parallel beta-helix repeat-containing protein [Flavobacteriales bacterium]MBK7942205.1 right-handed parallel beta-helix repeat-containing protein [Flavobacteriales bacterium]
MLHDGGGTLAISDLPTSSAPYRYTGAVAAYSQAAQIGPNGGLLFFIVDGNIYDGQGYLIADNVLASPCHECLYAGNGEVLILPVPEACDRYFIVHAGKQPPLNSPQTDVNFSLLDMSLPNRYHAGRNGRVVGLDQELQSYGLDTDFPDLPQQIDVTQPGLLNLSSNSPVEYYHAEIDLGGGVKPGTVSMDAIPYQDATGDLFLALATRDELVQCRVTPSGIDVVASHPIADSDPSTPRDHRTFIQFQQVSSTSELLLAITCKHGLNDTDLPVPPYLPLAVMRFQGDGTYVRMDGYNPGTQTAGSTNHLVMGCAVDPSGSYLYFTMHGEAPALGYVDLATGVVVDLTTLNLGITVPMDFVYSRIEPGVAPNGTSPALYYWTNGRLGCLVDPQTPAAATWLDPAPTTDPIVNWPTLPLPTGTNVPFARIGNVQVNGFDPAATFGAPGCCVSTALQQAFQGPYSTAASGVTWTPQNNPFGSGAEVVFDQDYVIGTGANIVVHDMTWRFTPNARLIVQRGARIEFNTCVLTALACEGQRWPGIRVEGTTNDPLQSGSAHGRLYLKDNSVVENAVVGVWCAREIGLNSTDPNYFGGWVRGWQSTFRNCITGVRAERYHRAGANGELPNLCLFVSCTFETTAGWPDLNVPPAAMAHLYDVNGVTFQNCDLRNDAFAGFATPDQRGIGIVAYNASFNATGAMNYAQNGFRNLTAGVLAYVPVPPAHYTVDGMAFENNKFGVLDLASRHAVVTNNHFSTLATDPMNGPSSIGLFLVQSELYTVERNTFTRPGSAQCPGIGIWFKGPALEENQIYDNTFADLNAACVVEGRHVAYTSNLNTLPGLQLLCGDHTNNFIDQFLIQSAFIRENQGLGTNATTLANNRFDLAADCDLNAWPARHPFVFALTDYGLHVDYHYYAYSGNPELRPECVEDEFGVAYDYTGGWFYDLLAHFHPNPFDKDQHCGAGDLDQIIGDLEEYRQTYMAKVVELGSAVNTYNGVVDGGGRPDLLDAIADPVAWPSHALRSVLLANGPLSNEVLTEAIRREVAMDPWHLTQVLIDNSPLKKDVEIVLDESEALPPFHRALLAQYDQGTSPRDLLEMEIVQRSQEKSRLQHRLVLAVAADSTLAGKPDSLMNIYLADSLHLGSRTLYTMHLAAGNFGAAHALASGALQHEGHAGLVAFGELLETMAGDPNSLTAPPIAALEALAFGEENSGSAQAWATLLRLGATDSLPQGWLPEPYRMAYFPADRKGWRIAPLLGAYPNPARDRVMISYPEGAEQGTLEFFDAQGRLVAVQPLNGRRVFHEMDVYSWGEGLYLARLLYEGRPMADVKFSVVR